MSWIKTILPNEATGSLKKIYHKLFPNDKDVKNINLAASLRPETLEQSAVFESSILYAKDNKLPPWFIEALGVYVSYLNGCEYCIEHHHDKMKTLLKDNKRSEEIRSALAENQPAKVFDVWEGAIMKYGEKLTKTPATLTEEDVGELRLCGLEDQEILEVAQAVSLFNYNNRIALGLGITVEDHLMGLSSEK